MMLDPNAMKAALDNQNCQAFLRLIRAGESGQTDAAYTVMFGGGHFESFADHPRQVITRNGLTSTAAGAYQFLSRTWDECAKELALPDFSPASQDLAAVFLIYRRGALADVLAGRVELAISRCAKEWASLPGSPYGQPTRTLAQALATYAQYGGQAAEQPRTADPQPAAPTPSPTSTERPMPGILGSIVSALSVANPLVGLIAGMFEPLVQDKIDKELGRHTDNPAAKAAIETAMMQAAQMVTGKTEPLQAVAALQSQPELIKQVQAVTLEKLDELAPLFDAMHRRELEMRAADTASMDAASARNRSDGYDMTPVLLFGALGVILLLILLVAFIVIWQVVDTGAADTASWAALMGLIGWATGVGTTIYFYRFGSTRNSSANQVAMAELAKRP